MSIGSSIGVGDIIRGFPFAVEWSEQHKEFVATHGAFPSLSQMAPDPTLAIELMVALICGIVSELESNPRLTEQIG